MEQEPVTGRVVALQANFCRVRLDRAGPGQQLELLCVRRTRLGKSGQQVHVGDQVSLDGVDWTAGRAAVCRLFPRSSRLERPAVANCTRLLVVVALAQPEPDPVQITRFLLAAEATDLQVELVLSKIDLVPRPGLEAWLVRLKGWGYDPIGLSVATGEGLELLRQRLAEPGITVLCGPSVVGKSSLLNALIPALQLRVAAVSGRLQRGRHTTRHVELFALGPEALLADTPGFNRPDLPLDPSRLAALFPEMRQALRSGACRYRNCLHRGDPGCCVGTDWDRYPHYLQGLEELLLTGGPGAVRRSPDPEVQAERPEVRLDRRQRLPSRRRLRQSEQEGLSPPSPTD